MVAHTPLKTPTAVAAWLNERMATLEARIEELAGLISDAARARTSAEHLRIERWAGLVRELATQATERHRSRLMLLHEQLRSTAERLLERERARLQLATVMVEAHNPKSILKRGFAVVRRNGEALLSIDGVEQGQRVEIELAEGHLTAEVESITRR
jgi:exodeoxyribonuclease VII large subunit